MSMAEDGMVSGLPGVKCPSPGVEEVLAKALTFAKEYLGYHQAGRTILVGTDAALSAAAESPCNRNTGPSFSSSSSLSWSLAPNAAAVSDRHDGSVATEGKKVRNPLTRNDMHLLLTARGEDYQAVIWAADRVREMACGEKVTYVVNRNINYTNVCTFK